MNFDEFVKGFSWAYKSASYKGYYIRAHNVLVDDYTEGNAAGIMVGNIIISETCDMPCFSELGEGEQLEAIRQWGREK